MGWSSSLGAIFASLLMLFVPGIISGVIIRLRGLWLWALAPLFSATLVLIATVLGPILNLVWSPIPASALVLALAAGLAALVRMVLRKKLAVTIGKSSKSDYLALIALVISAAVLTFHYLQGIVDVNNISQTFDNVFHLNIVAYAIDTQNASPLFVGTLTSPEASLVFYPDLWHAFVSLVSVASGVSVPIAVNSFNLVVLITVWPLGAFILLRQFITATPLIPIFGVLASAFPAYPLYLIHYGVLYPYFLGISLLPAALALVLQALGLSRDKSIGTWIVPAVLLIAVVPGLAVAHPGAMMGLLALSVPFAVAATLTGWRTLPKKIRITRLSFLALYGILGLVMLIKLRPGESGLWGTRMSVPTALQETFMLNLFGLGFPILLAALTLIGAIYAIVSRVPIYLGLLGMWLVSILLYLVTAAKDGGRFKLWTTGPWYGDSPRVAPFLALSAMLLSALAILWAYKWLEKKQLRSSTLIVSLSTILLLIFTQMGSGFTQLSKWLQGSYEYSEKSALISTDELKLLQRLPDMVPEGSVIVGSPWTGTSLAYAYADRQVLLPHIFTNLGESGWKVLNGLKFAETRSEVCDAVLENNILYVLDFGDIEVHGGNNVYPGLVGIEETSVVELVDSEGDARLMRVTACGLN